jgi:hypothetical protein
VAALATPLWDISAWLRPCFRLLFVLIVDESVISRVALGPLGNKGLQATLRPGSGTFREPGCTDKKENQNFLIFKEIQSGAVAKSYMRKGFLIYEEMHKYFPIFVEAVSHI